MACAFASPIQALPRSPRRRPRSHLSHTRCRPFTAPIAGASTEHHQPAEEADLTSTESSSRHAGRLTTGTPPLSARNKALSRRAVLALAAAALVGTSVANKAPPASASVRVGLAPTPINPYARRRQTKAYEDYVRALEDTFENVPVADLRKVVQAGGGGLSVGYRIAGGAAFVASALSTAVVHPIDSMKTRLQAGMKTPLLKGLYKGVLSNILKEAPNAAIYLGMYELIKSGLMNLQVTSFFKDLPLLTFLIAGALGDAIGSIVRVPAEVVNKRLQLGLSDSWISALMSAFGTSAARRDTAVAWQATLWRDVPYGGLQIMLYEFGKMVLERNGSCFPAFIPHGGLAADVMVGALAGMLAAIATTPADVLVTRVAMLSGRGETAGDVWQVLSGVVRENGPFGLFKGALERGLYYAPMIGLFFALYEGASHALIDPHAAIVAVKGLTSGLQAQVNHALDAVHHSTANAVEGTIPTSLYLLVEQMPFVLSLLSIQG